MRFEGARIHPKRHPGATIWRDESGQRCSGRRERAKELTLEKEQSSITRPSVSSEAIVGEGGEGLGASAVG